MINFKTNAVRGLWHLLLTGIKFEVGMKPISSSTI